MTTQQERAELIRKLESVPLCSAVPSLEDERVMLMVGSYCKQAAALLAADARGGEAVAWMFRFPHSDLWHLTKFGPNTNSRRELTWEPLYTHPQPERVPLTEQEADRLIEKHAGGAEWTDDEYRSAVKLIRDTESAHHIGKPAPVGINGLTEAETKSHREALAQHRAALEKMQEALEFYAGGSHFTMHDPDAWDTVSGEPQNFYEDENNTATVEDGSIAKAAITEAERVMKEPAPVGPLEDEHGVVAGK